MKGKNESIKLIPDKADIIDITADGLVAIVSNIPNSHNLTSYLLSTGFSFTATRIGKWSEPIIDFIKSTQSKKGKDAEKAYSKFFETLKFLAKEQPADDELMKSLRDLHILSLLEETDNGKETEIYMLLDLARALKGEHVVTLLTAYKIGHNLYSKEETERIFAGFKLPINRSTSWCEIISRACHYTNSDYIIRQQKTLEDMHLISEREHSIRGNYKEDTFLITSCFRLTKSGERLASFIIDGEKVKP